MRNKKTLFLVNHEVCFVIFVNRIVHWFTEHPVITDYELDSAGGSGGGTECWRSERDINMGCCEVSSGAGWAHSVPCACSQVPVAWGPVSCTWRMNGAHSTRTGRYTWSYRISGTLGAQSSFYFKMRFLLKTDGEIGLISESKRYDLILILGCMNAWILELPPMFNGLRKSIHFFP